MFIRQCYSRTENLLRSWLVAYTNRSCSLSPLRLQILCLMIGSLLLSLGLSSAALSEPDGLTVQYNDLRFAEATNAILSYLEGSFGALIMVVAGLIAIISAAFGQYRAAIGCLIIAVGAFILRSFIGTFFNDGSIME